MKIFRKKLPAFTLLEMLVVMSVFMILLAIGIEAFSGLRSTILMNQSVENFKQNVKWTQRAAVLLKRDPGENWLYGVGLDLTGFYTPPYEYRIFKWCSESKEFNDDPRAQSYFPNFIPGNQLSPTNGQIDTNPSSCVGNTTGLKTIAKDEEQRGVGAVADFVVPEPLQIGYKQGGLVTTAGNPGYVLYEAVTGNVFYYTSAGVLENYDINLYSPTNPDELILDFVIAPRGRERGINIKINPVSGRVVTKVLNSVEVSSYIFN